MNEAALQKTLLHLFARHEVELEPDDEGWLTTDGDFPAIRAHWHAGNGEQPGRLELDVVLGEDSRIEESFAGSGEGEAACREALSVFEQTALPALLAACWYVTDDRRLQVAAWSLGIHTWDVFIGPFHVRGSDAAMPGEAVAAIEHALAGEALAPRLHWVRLAHRCDAAGSRSEALLDNEPWAAGTRALEAAPWPKDADYGASALLLIDIRDY